MCIDCLVKVLVLLDQGLYIVTLRVDLLGSEERLPVRHPVLCLLTVPVEQLQVQVLI